MGIPIEAYDSHSGFYRGVDSLSKPWIPSPVVLPDQLPDTLDSRPLVPVSVATSDSSGSSVAPGGGSVLKIQYGWPQTHTSPLRKFLRTFTRLLKRRKDLLRIATLHPSDLDPPHPPAPIPLSEWKAWAYYALPHVNGGVVRNYSPAPKISTAYDLEEMFHGLKSPGGKHDRDRWIEGQTHGALPPRPRRWQIPTPGVPLPFPWECQINPFLYHAQFGDSPLAWNVGFRPITILFNTDEKLVVPLDEPDTQQPATHPFVTHMYINAVSDDPAPKFRWPIMIKNINGIKCRDVFQGIYDNFQEFVAIEELQSWGIGRQEQAHAAHNRRRVMFDLSHDCAMRRIDYFGNHTMFRGLEPNPNKEGWVLFMGLS